MNFCPLCAYELKNRVGGSHPLNQVHGIKPKTMQERRDLLNRCSSKCFLGNIIDEPLKFPICSKFGSCQPVYPLLLAAEIRAKSTATKLRRRGETSRAARYSRVGLRAARLKRNVVKKS